MKKIFLGLCALFLSLVTAMPAGATLVPWNWQLEVGGFSWTGTLVVDDVTQDLQSFDGITPENHTISLVPMGHAWFGNDNKFVDSFPYFDEIGTAVNISGIGNTALYSLNGGAWLFNFANFPLGASEGDGLAFRFTVSEPTAMPEPPSTVLVLLALGVLTASMRTSVSLRGRA